MNSTTKPIGLSPLLRAAKRFYEASPRITVRLPHESFGNRLEFGEAFASRVLQEIYNHPSNADKQESDPDPSYLTFSRMLDLYDEEQARALERWRARHSVIDMNWSTFNAETGETEQKETCPTHRTPYKESPDEPK